MGYEEYLLQQENNKQPDEPIHKTKEKPQKKTFTTPAKEKAKRERALKKAEEKVAFLEAKIEELKAELSAPENLSDYVKLSALGEELDALEEELLNALDEWEKLAE